MMKITLCPVCKQPVTANHSHTAKDASEKFRRQASTKVRVLIPKIRKGQQR